MDDAFAYRTTVPIHRQLDPRALKAGIFFAVIALGIGFFAHWVMASERDSFVRADRHDAPSEVAVTQIGVGADPAMTDGDAKDAARVALVAARAAFTQRKTFGDAGPSQLTELQPGYMFVDGPSTMPRIVSIATTGRVWAAAIQSPTGTCFWVRATGAAAIERGTATECTGAAALTATALGW
jgi:hypothetical protein